MKKKIIAVLIGIGAILGFSIPVLAVVYSMSINVHNGGATSYTNIPVSANVNNAQLVTSGLIPANGLTTRVFDGATSLPHMVVEDKTLFVFSIAAGQTKNIKYKTSQTPLTQFKIIPGYGGNVTIADSPTLELDRHFDISISGYFDMRAP